MKEDQLKFIQKLKPYHIILLACILSPLLVINSNYANKKRAREKLNLQKKRLFDKIISTRTLNEGELEPNESESNNSTNSDKVCGRGTEELRNYYKTGDLAEIDIDKSKGLECEEKEKAYFKSLINIIKIALGSDEGEEEEEGDIERNESELRNLLSIDEVKDDIINYGKHLIPVLIFLVLGILSLPAWPICCFCTCCNCCCCRCCKKPGCKIPCFIFTYIFYGLSVAICIYGFSQTNKIFVGIADTECTILKFFDQVLEGETKNTTPRWPGIEGIDNIIGDITGEIDNLKSGTLETLRDEINMIEGNKTVFKNKMRDSGNSFFDSTGKYISAYSKDYNIELNERILNGKYVLDLIKFFGKRKTNSDEEEYTPKNSLLDLWHMEYKLVSENADSSLQDANETFTNVADNSTGDITELLQEGTNTLNEIKGTFNDIKSEIENLFVDSSDLIEDYGKLGVKLVFGVLGLMNVALAALMLFICLCSGKMCTKCCCCCRCILKLFTHLLWNILALLTFITFMLGFIFSLIGTIGNDVMSVISYVLSEDNLKEGGDNILVDKLGESKKYLNECINGGGKILELLGIDPSQLDSMDNITGIEEQIEDARNNFSSKLDCYTYKIYEDKLKGRLNLSDSTLMLIESKTDFDLPLEDEDFIDRHKTELLSFETELNFMNTYIQASSLTYKNEKWEKGSNEAKSCIAGSSNDGITTGSITFNPLKCKPIDRDWILGLDNNENIYKEAKIVSDTLDLLKNAESLSFENKGYSKILEDLRKTYLKYLNQYICALDSFKRILNNITNKLKQYINKDEGIFSFIDCKFIGTNLKVMLKYLKSILGGNVKTIGICLSIVGCSLGLSISSTILLIVIINIDIDNNKKQLDAEKIPEYQLNSGGRVIQYKD